MESGPIDFYWLFVQLTIVDSMQINNNSKDKKLLDEMKAILCHQVSDE